MFKKERVAVQISQRSVVTDGTELRRSSVWQNKEQLHRKTVWIDVNTDQISGKSTQDHEVFSFALVRVRSLEFMGSGFVQ